VAAASYPAVVAAVVVATGHHYVLDVVAAAVVWAVAVAVAHLRRAGARPRAAMVPAALHAHPATLVAVSGLPPGLAPAAGAEARTRREDRRVAVDPFPTGDAARAS
jgi:hypothetical protein